jgi:hypothetical protein
MVRIAIRCIWTSEYLVGLIVPEKQHLIPKENVQIGYELLFTDSQVPTDITSAKPLRPCRCAMSAGLRFLWSNFRYSLLVQLHGQ